MGIVFIIGTPIFGVLENSFKNFAMIFLNSILIITAFASIYNCITMLCSDITISTVCCILTFIILYVISSSLGYTKDIGEYSTHITFENGVETVLESEKNPNYPGEKVVKIAKIVYLFIPQGQANEILSGNTEELNQFPFYSIFVIFVMNLIGICCFSKKELK